MVVPKGGVNVERWNEILDAAGKTFYEKGYQAARIEDIATRVGILRGSLYHYIASKEDLLYALCIAGHRTGLATIDEDDATRAAGAPARLAAFIDRWMAMMRQHPEYAPVAERDARHLSAERQTEIKEMRNRMHLFARGIFEQGIANGDFDPTFDRGVATDTLFEMLSGTIRWFRPTGRLTHTEVSAYYKTILLRGLRSEHA